MDSRWRPRAAAVTWIGSCPAAKIDCVILDVGLPGEDGLSICRRLRGKSSVPIIMVTGRGTDTDRIVGLELGADDYLPKPFNPRELVARVRAVMRRGNGIEAPPAEAPQVLMFEGWRLDMARRQLFAPDGGPRSLTSGEFNILSIFCQQSAEGSVAGRSAGSAARARGGGVRPQHRRADQPAAAEDRDQPEGSVVHQDGAVRRLFLHAAGYGGCRQLVSPRKDGR